MFIFLLTRQKFPLFFFFLSEMWHSKWFCIEVGEFPNRVFFFFGICRRGLSKFYEGKSQSYTSLASVKSLEDLAKRATPIRKKMKACKSYGGGLDGNRSSYNPKAKISKKSSRGSFFWFSNLGSCRPNSTFSLQKNF